MHVEQEQLPAARQQDEWKICALEHWAENKMKRSNHFGKSVWLVQIKNNSQHACHRQLVLQPWSQETERAIRSTWPRNSEMGPGRAATRVQARLCPPRKSKGSGLLCWAREGKKKWKAVGNSWSMINKKNQKGEALKKLRAHIHITSTMPSAEIRHKVSRKNHSGKFRILAAENGSIPFRYACGTRTTTCSTTTRRMKDMRPWTLSRK